MPFTIQTRLKKNHDASARKRYEDKKKEEEEEAEKQALSHQAMMQQQQQKPVVKKKYFLQFIFTKEHKYLLPFSRRMVDIDLQRLIDENQASLSINCGLIDVLMYDYINIPNKKVIRIIDETMDEYDVLQYLIE